MPLAAVAEPVLAHPSRQLDLTAFRESSTTVRSG
jgi:hypothetical protein